MVLLNLTTVWNGQPVLHFFYLSFSTPDQAASEINNHFSAVCQTLPPLDLTCFPTYLPSPTVPWTIEEYQVASKLRALKAKRSTTQIDVPIKIYQEFSYELAIPLTAIINVFLLHCRCPADWKMYFVNPVPKVNNPNSLNELRL